MAAMASARGLRPGDGERRHGHGGVSRRTFYDQFSDKEDCFLARSTRSATSWSRLARHAARGTRPARGRSVVRQALAALLQLLAADPAFARVALVEVLCAGHAALERRDALLDRFACPVGVPRQSPAPATVVVGDRRLARAVIGGPTRRCTSSSSAARWSGSPTCFRTFSTASSSRTSATSPRSASASSRWEPEVGERGVGRARLGWGGHGSGAGAPLGGEGSVERRGCDEIRLGRAGARAQSSGEGVTRFGSAAPGAGRAAGVWSEIVRRGRIRAAGAESGGDGVARFGSAAPAAGRAAGVWSEIVRRGRIREAGTATRSKPWLQ